MQDLVIVNANEVIIQNQGKVYFDTFQNFLSDYSKEFGYTSIDYNKATQHAYIDGQPFQERGQPCRLWKSTISGWMCGRDCISDLKSQFSMKQ